MRRIIILILMLPTFTGYITATAQSSACIVKKSFAADSATELSIINKYGDITIINTDEDSVSICATASVDYPDAGSAARGLELINTDISGINNLISATTTFSDKFFSQQYSEGRKGFSVNYMVKLPEYLNVRLVNSFGTVTIDEIAGRADISVVHGTLIIRKLTRGNEKPLNSIILKNSKGEIHSAGWLGIELSHSPSFELVSAQALSAFSEFSTVFIGSVNSAVISSMSDVYSIEEATNCVFEGKLSKIKIGSVSGLFKTEVSLSTVTLNHMKPEFRLLEIKGEDSGFFIWIDPLASYRLSARYMNASLLLPIEDKGNFRSEVSLDNTEKVSGYAGADSQPASEVNINLNHGRAQLFRLRKNM
jgi:hypothetical protein